MGVRCNCFHLRIVNSYAARYLSFECYVWVCVWVCVCVLSLRACVSVGSVGVSFRVCWSIPGIAPSCGYLAIPLGLVHSL